jgi:hypothetical protein
LREQAGQRGNGTARVAVGVHVRGEHHVLAGPQFCGKPLDCGATLDGWLQQVR